MKKGRYAQAALLLFFLMFTTAFSQYDQFQRDVVMADTIEETGLDSVADGLTAGVAALCNSNDVKPVELTAGIGSMLIDFDSGEVYIEKVEKQKVQAAQEEWERAKEQIKSWGYNNLGVANVEESLNVRKEPSGDSKKVGELKKGAVCEIISTEDGWSKITSGEVEGYVAAEYLVTDKAAYEIAKDEVCTVAEVQAKNLRVRKEASTDSGIIRKVSNGTQLRVLEKLDGWVKVSVNDTEAYVSADYVEIKQVLPVAETAAALKYGAGVSEERVDLVENALQYVGNRYVWGGTSLTNGVDCSGFTMKIMAQYGVYLPHSSKAQPSCGTKISSSEAKPGDLFFYGDGGSINHVAIYMGDGKIVHASNSRDGIKVSNAFYRTPICVVRYLD